MQFLSFLAGLSVHFLIELYTEWNQSKKITWSIHIFPVVISLVVGGILSYFSGKLNLAGNILNMAFAVAGFLTNYLLQKLFKWNTPKSS